MNKNIVALMLLGMLTLGASAHADTTETVIGAAIGSAAGAAIGQKANRGNNVVIWSALGGATGAYIGQRLGEPPRQREVIVKEQRVHHVYEDDYVVVHRPTYVVYEEPRYHKHYKHEHHHHHDRDDD